MRAVFAVGKGRTEVMGAALFLALLSPACSMRAQQAQKAAAVIAMVDEAVRLRVANVAGFSDIEHYAVYRGSGAKRPAAEMTVRDTYTKDKGKVYTILSQSGSGIILKFGLKPLLENETAINQPDKAAQSWFTSANYAMTLQGGVEQVNGRACYGLAIQPRRRAPNMVEGTIWVDARDGTLVKVDGVASKSPSPFAGSTHMMREYRNIEGYAMATRARGESKSMLFGRTVVVIDYSDYHLQTRPAGVAPH